MLRSVDFISLPEFERVAPAPDLAVISIGDPDEPVPLSLTNFPRTLRLSFLDLEAADVASSAARGLFTRTQAARVVCFITELQARDAPVRLLIHCMMGASRSAAVALVAHAMTGCEFPRRQDAFYANTHVVALGADAAGCSVNITPHPDASPHAYLPSALAI